MFFFYFVAYISLWCLIRIVLLFVSVSHFVSLCVNALEAHSMIVYSCPVCLMLSCVFLQMEGNFHLSFIDLTFLFLYFCFPFSPPLLPGFCYASEE